MRQLLLALLLVAAMLPVGQAQTDPTAPDEMEWLVDAAGDPVGPAAVTVDLEVNRGHPLQFKVDDQRFDDASPGEKAQSAVVELVCEKKTTANGPGCPHRKETITLAMGRTSSSSPWTAALNVNNPLLVAGDWKVQARGVFSGHAEPLLTSIGSLDVNGPAVGSIVLRALNTDADTGTVYVGGGQSVQATVRHQNTVQAPMFRSVEYTIDDSDRFGWSSPYSLSADTFSPGQHTVTVYAEDRIGQTKHISFHVYADTVRPSVSASMPDVLYRDIPNPIRLVVDEHSDFDATASFGSAHASASAEAGTGREVILMLTPTALGSGALQVTVRDAVGNELTLSQDSRVEPLRTNVVLHDADQVDGGAIPGEELVLRITAGQLDGLADVPINVTFMGVDVGQITVNQTQQTTQDLSFDLPPGQHEGMLVLSVPSGVNEVNATNQEMEITVDKFLARVIHGSDRYHIRGDASGLPQEAVGADGTTYALTTQDRGLGTVYVFTVDGTQLWWDPSSTTTTVPLQGDDGDKGIPAIPVVFLLLAMAVAAVRRR